MNKIVVIISLCIFIISCESGTIFQDLFIYDNQIIFSSYKKEKWQIYGINPYAGKIINISYGEYEHWNGIISPDNKWMVCSTNQNAIADAPSSVMINLKTGERKLIGNISFPCWGEDELYYHDSGRNYIYNKNGIVENTNLTSQILCYDVSLSGNKSLLKIKTEYNKTRIIIATYPDFSPVDTLLFQNCNIVKLSPDGNSLLYCSKAETYNANIYTFDMVTRKTKKLTSAMSTDSYPQAMWSPDGSEIVYKKISGNSGCNCEIGIMNSDGTEKRIIYEDKSVMLNGWKK